jgi:L-methionine (R)-S-oxide reductase
MNFQFQRALQDIDGILKAPRSVPKQLTDICQVLQQLPGYTGVYIYALEGNTLVLKAFSGRVTEHTRIPSGKGICGASVKSRAPVVVSDVVSDPRYLACNIETQSEIVYPILRDDTYLAQIDVDSDDRATFDADDEAFLKRVSERLAPLF